MKTYGLILIIVGLLLLLLTACDTGGASAPGPAVGPMIGYNGKVGVGFDLGNGVYMSPTGKLGYGF
jgi:hypothetical protein